MKNKATIKWTAQTIVALVVYGIISILFFEYIGIFSVLFYAALVLLLLWGTPKAIEADTVYFTKLHDDAIVPSRKEADAGYDIYARFDDKYIEIAPHETKMIPTGIASCFSSKFVMVLKERGSTGTKGMAQRCGVIDSGFRGEWMVPITNTTNKSLFISKATAEFTENDDQIIYPYSKAICQALLLPVNNDINMKEVNAEEFAEFTSERGTGMLGSSGK